MFLPVNALGPGAWGAACLRTRHIDLEELGQILGATERPKGRTVSVTLPMGARGLVSLMLVNNEIGTLHDVAPGTMCGGDGPTRGRGPTD